MIRSTMASAVCSVVGDENTGVESNLRFAQRVLLSNGAAYLAAPALQRFVFAIAAGRRCVAGILLDDKVNLASETLCDTKESLQ